MATEAKGDTGDISGSERAGRDGVGNKLEELRYTAGPSSSLTFGRGAQIGGGADNPGREGRRAVLYVHIHRYICVCLLFLLSYVEAEL